MNAENDPTSASVPERITSFDTGSQATSNEMSNEDGQLTESAPERPQTERKTDRCEVCDSSIDPTEYRVSRIVTTRYTTVERHYCSEECLRTDFDEDSPDRADSGRDWSYCR